MPTTVSTSSTTGFHLWTDVDFLEWLEPGIQADLIDGEKCMHSPVNLNHARLLNFLDSLIRNYLEQNNLGGELHREVVAVRLSSRNVFLPDLAYFTAEQVPELKETHAPFAPLWVCEALSPRTADRNVGPKFAAYEEHGVNEYWVLDPDTLAHRFYRRDKDLLVEYAEGEEWIDSEVISGLKVRRDWLNPPRIPRVSDCLGSA